MVLSRLLKFFLSLCFFSASILTAAPVITQISPSVGPSTGSTNVTLTGTGFTGATAINFGSAPAGGFIVLSDTTAIAAPNAHTPQVTTVTITTPSGTSPATDNTFFTFQGSWQAYVPNGDDDTVSAINVDAQAVVATIPADQRPVSVALTPSGSQAWVINFGSTVTIIDTATNTVINTIPVAFDPEAIAITPNGTRAYITSRVAQVVTAIDIATQTIITTIPVGDCRALAISPNGTRVYVANVNDNNVSVIDTSSNTVIATVTVGTVPLALTTTTDGTKVYVANFLSSSVSVIDAATNTVITTIPVGSLPNAIALTPDGTRAYTANGSGSVSVIDIATNTVIATLPVGANPVAIAVMPDNAVTADPIRAYVVNGNDDTVSVIDVATNTVIATIPVGGGPVAIAITPDGKQVYVANNDDSSVTLISTETNTVIRTILVGGEPIMIGITPDQAPLARFTINAQGVGLPTTFDASDSVSPTGTIANYFWDFGDGNTLSTASPVVTHVYTTTGTFTVVLIVTNTAGTSLTQILGFYSYNGGTASPPITNNNGGPTARTSHVLVITAPPAAFIGCIDKNKFLNKTEYILRATWTASPSIDVAFFRIFENGILVAEVPASAPFSFEICLRHKEEAFTFSIAAVSSAGVESPRRPIRITREDCCKNRS